MSTFKAYFSINCYSFTLLILIYAVLDKLNVFPPVTSDHIFVYFLMTTLIAILIALTNKLPIKNNLLCSLIRLLDITLVVFSLGITFKIFPLDWFIISIIMGMILVIYFGVQGLLIIKDHSDAHAINKQLTLKKKEKKDRDR